MAELQMADIFLFTLFLHGFFEDKNWTRLDQKSYLVP